MPGRVDGAGVPGGLVLRDGRGCAGRVRCGHLLSAGFDGTVAVRGGHVEQRDGKGGGVRRGVRVGALLRGRITRKNRGCERLHVATE